MRKVIISLCCTLFLILCTIFIKNNVNPSFHNFANKKDDKKDILLVTHFVEQTGAQIMLFNLADILLENGYSVYLYAYRDGNMRKVYKKRGVKIIVDKKYEKNYDFSKIVQQFDLVITNDLWTSSSYLLANKYVPTIWWIHAFPEYNKTIMNIYDDIYYSKPNIFPSYDWVLSKAKYLVSVSELLSDSVKQINSNNINIIHNIIDEEIILCEKKEKNTDIISFSFITWMGYNKGTDILIDAILLLPEKYKNKAEFNLVGNNDSVEKLKSKTINNKNIKWLGTIPYKNMKKIYAQTDVLLHPSRKDTVALTVLEAAANSIPSVISDNTGSTYIIKDGESGFVVPVGDAEALKEKIMWFIDNPEQIEVMGKKANQYYKETSSKEIFEEKWLKLIEQVLLTEKK